MKTTPFRPLSRVPRALPLLVALFLGLPLLLTGLRAEPGQKPAPEAAEADKRRSLEEVRAEVARNTRTLGDGHANTIRSQRQLASRLWLQGKKGEAMSEYRAIIRHFERDRFAPRPLTPADRLSLPEILSPKERREEARQEADRVYAVLCQQWGDNDPLARALKEFVESVKGE